MKPDQLENLRRAKKVPAAKNGAGGDTENRRLHQWMPIVRAAAKARPTTRVDNAAVVLLAALLTFAGAPTSPTGQRVFAALKSMLLSRTHNLVSYAVSLIPADKKALVKIAECVEAYKKYVPKPKRSKGLEQGRYQIPKVLIVMLAVPNPDAYVRWVVEGGSEGVEAVAYIFHPDVFNSAKQSLFKLDFDERGYSEHQEQLDRAIEKLS